MGRLRHSLKKQQKKLHKPSQKESLKKPLQARKKKAVKKQLTKKKKSSESSRLQHELERLQKDDWALSVVKNVESRLRFNSPKSGKSSLSSVESKSQGQGPRTIPITPSPDEHPPNPSTPVTAVINKCTPKMKSKFKKTQTKISKGFHFVSFNQQEVGCGGHPLSPGPLRGMPVFNNTNTNQAKLSQPQHTGKSAATKLELGESNIDHWEKYGVDATPGLKRTSGIQGDDGDDLSDPVLKDSGLSISGKSLSLQSPSLAEAKCSHPSKSETEAIVKGSRKRKKLRSQALHGELWEGFPFNIQMTKAKKRSSSGETSPASECSTPDPNAQPQRTENKDEPQALMKARAVEDDSLCPNVCSLSSSSSSSSSSPVCPTEFLHTTSAIIHMIDTVLGESSPSGETDLSPCPSHQETATQSSRDTQSQQEELGDKQDTITSTPTEERGRSCPLWALTSPIEQVTGASQDSRAMDRRVAFSFESEHSSLLHDSKSSGNLSNIHSSFMRAFENFVNEDGDCVDGKRSCGSCTESSDMQGNSHSTPESSYTEAAPSGSTSTGPCTITAPSGSTSTGPCTITAPSGSTSTGPCTITAPSGSTSTGPCTITAPSGSTSTGPCTITAPSGSPTVTTNPADSRQHQTLESNGQQCETSGHNTQTACLEQDTSQTQVDEVKSIHVEVYASSGREVDIPSTLRSLGSIVSSLSSKGALCNVQDVSNSNGDHHSNHTESPLRKVLKNDRAPKRSPRLEMKRKFREKNPESNPENQRQDYVYPRLKRRDSDSSNNAPSSPQHDPEDPHLEEGQEDQPLKKPKIEVEGGPGNGARSPPSRSACSVSETIETHDTVVTRSRARSPHRYGMDPRGLQFSSLPEQSPRSRRQRDARGPPCSLDLLKDPRLAKHACLLWSSEQRRRFQQQHADLGSGQLDEMMRCHWEGLGDRERLRYYQRAWHALNDKNRHARPTGAQANTRANTGGRSPAYPSLEQEGIFNILSPSRQFNILQHKLSELQQRMPPAQYSHFITGFMAAFAEAREALRARLAVEGAVEAGIKQQLDGVARRLMYTRLVEEEQRRDVDRLRRQARLRRQVQDQYRWLVEDLLQGMEPELPQDMTSARLTQVLNDLQHMEDQHPHEPDEVESQSIQTIKASLQTGAPTLDLNIAGETVTVAGLGNTRLQADLLRQAALQSDLPCLGPADVDRLLEAHSGEETPGHAVKCGPRLSDVALQATAEAVDRCMHGRQSCCALDSASCVLSGLLARERLRQEEGLSRLEELLRRNDRQEGEDKRLQPTHTTSADLSSPRDTMPLLHPQAPHIKAAFSQCIPPLQHSVDVQVGEQFTESPPSTEVQRRCPLPQIDHDVMAEDMSAQDDCDVMTSPQIDHDVMVEDVKRLLLKANNGST